MEKSDSINLVPTSHSLSSLSSSSSPSLARTAQVRNVSRGGIGVAASKMKASVSAWFSTLRTKPQVVKAGVDPNLGPRANMKLGERIKVLNKKV